VTERVVLVGWFGGDSASEESDDTASAVGEVIEGVGENGCGVGKIGRKSLHSKEKDIAYNPDSTAEYSVLTASGRVGSAIGVFDKKTDKRFSGGNFFHDMGYLA